MASGPARGSARGPDRRGHVEGLGSEPVPQGHGHAHRASLYRPSARPLSGGVVAPSSSPVSGSIATPIQ